MYVANSPAPPSIASSPNMVTFCSSAAFFFRLSSVPSVAPTFESTTSSCISAWFCISARFRLSLIQSKLFFAAAKPKNNLTYPEILELRLSASVAVRCTSFLNFSCSTAAFFVLVSISSNSTETWAKLSLAISKLERSIGLLEVCFSLSKSLIAMFKAAVIFFRIGLILSFSPIVA